MHEIKYQVINLDNCQSNQAIVFDNTHPVHESYVEDYFRQNFPNLLLINHQEKQVLLGNKVRETEFLISSIIPYEQFYLLVPGYDHIIVVDNQGTQYGIQILSDEGFEVFEYPFVVEFGKFARNKVSHFIETPHLLNHWLLETKRFTKMIKIS
jgi:hypothetical protein